MTDSYCRNEEYSERRLNKTLLLDFWYSEEFFPSTCQSRPCLTSTIWRSGLPGLPKSGLVEVSFQIGNGCCLLGDIGQLIIWLVNTQPLNPTTAQHSQNEEVPAILGDQWICLREFSPAGTGHGDLPSPMGGEGAWVPI